MNVTFSIFDTRLIISTLDTITGASTYRTIYPTWDYEIDNPTGTPTGYSISIYKGETLVGTYQYADFGTSGFFGHQPPPFLYIDQNIMDIVSSGSSNPPAPPITNVPSNYRITVGAPPITLHNTLAGTGGGAWTSSDPSITVNPLGQIQGVFPGNATISFQPQGSYLPATTLYITSNP